jgi:hypothetical protein
MEGVNPVMRPPRKPKTPAIDELADVWKTEKDELEKRREKILKQYDERLKDVKV